MVSGAVTQVVVGLYLGLLAGIFPAVVAFALGFGFRYLTGVSIPGFGVVVLAGALAGISGGLLGLVDSEAAQSWSGITAILVVLMLSLWAHSQGDKLGDTVPRQLTLAKLRQVRLSSDILDRVDSYGQIRITPSMVGDIEGYPSLSDAVHAKIRDDSWKFPAECSLSELETRLAETLTETYDLAEVSVSVTERGLAEIRAVPAGAGLSRRVPSGKRAVSIRTLLPTGLARGDQVRLDLPDTSLTGEVLSARSFASESDQPPNQPPVQTETRADGGAETDQAASSLPRAPTTRGGEGEVTVLLSIDEARQVIEQEFAKLTVRSRGTSREYEAIEVLQQGGNQLRLVTVTADGPLDGVTLAEARPRRTYGVAVLAVRRPAESILSPRGTTRIEAGDELVVTGTPDALAAFREAVT
jgi:hypothetical protein